MLAYQLMTGHYGPVLSLEQEWDEAFLELIRKNRIAGIWLKNRHGWNQSNSISFLHHLQGTGIQEIMMEDDEIADLSPIYALSSTLRALSIATIKRTVIDLGRFPRLQILSLNAGVTPKFLLDCRTLVELNIVGYTGKDTEAFSTLSRLESLAIHRAPVSSLLGLGPLRKLRCLYLSNLNKLESLEGIDRLDSLEELTFDRCRSVTRLDEVRMLQKLKVFRLIDCGTIESTRPLLDLSSLEIFRATGSTKIRQKDYDAIQRLPRLKFALLADTLVTDHSITSLKVSDMKSTFSRPEYLKRLKEHSTTLSIAQIDTNIDEMKNVLSPLTLVLGTIGIKMSSPYDYEDVVRRDKRTFRSALPYILRFFVSTKSVKARDYLASILETKWAMPEATKILKEEFAKMNTQETTRRAIAAALGKLSTKDDLEDLIRLFRTKEFGPGRGPLAYAISSTGRNEKPAKDCLIDALSDEEIAADAITALVRLKAKDALRQIKSLVSHKDMSIQRAAKIAVKRLEH